MKILATAMLALVLLSNGCAGGSTKATAKGKKTLYARVGGMPAIKALVGGALERILHDGRVNEYFKGADLEPLSEHFVQLACAATGGPCKYEGRGMKETHESMHVTNAAFDAVIEDIAFTMKKLKVRTAEQDEVVALFNGLRRDIVEIK